MSWEGLRRPARWSVLLCVLLVVLAAAMFLRDHVLASVLSAICAVAWLGYGSVARADRYNAPRVALLTAAATLLVTWSTSCVLAVLYGIAIANSHDAKDWIPIMLLVATNVGGLMAVFRSAQTRTETSAALREVSDLRIAVLSAPLVEAADRARQARVLEDLTASLSSMLQLAVGLSILPRVVDRASLWARDDEQGAWFICAATDVPASGRELRQPVLLEPKAGAGIVASFAFGTEPPVRERTRRDGDVYLIGESLGSHPWFRENPSEQRVSEGMAIVLLRREHAVIGALCFTWESAIIPTEGTQAAEMIDILKRWAHAFSIALWRLYRLREELRSR